MRMCGLFCADFHFLTAEGNAELEDIFDTLGGHIRIVFFIHNLLQCSLCQCIQILTGAVLCGFRFNQNMGNVSNFKGPA